LRPRLPFARSRTARSNFFSMACCLVRPPPARR